MGHYPVARYAALRRADPRIFSAVRSALGDVESVVNVGAGAGSYEPSDLDVVAVEPSEGMVAQRPPGAAPVVPASAESLPFADGAFDAALAVLTIHHWRDLSAGLREMRRVARRRIVVVHWDPAVVHHFWLVEEYLPAIRDIPTEHVRPEDVCAGIGWPCAVSALPIPWDCTDGFMGAYWRRPRSYLDPAARSAISAFAALGESAAPGLERLRADLESGAWERRHARLLDLDELDIGYRLVVADRAPLASPS